MKKLILLLLLALSFAAQTTVAQHRTVTRTRTAILFEQLEKQLGAALQQHDTRTIEKLTADHFEVRTGNAPGDPVPREEWIAAKSKPGEAGLHLSDIAVHMYGDTAVVSMTCSQADAKGEFLRVDVWNKSGEDWKLSVRYDAGAVPASKAADRKPTGKE